MESSDQYHTSFIWSKRIRSVLPNWLTHVLVKMKGGGVLKQPKYSSYEGSLDVLNCKVVYNSYGGFCIPLSSYTKSVAQAMYRGGQYEEETIKYIASLNPSGDIIHAGAYFGDLLPGLSQTRKGDAKIWTFEPGRESYRCAEITCLLNALDNVVLANVGLGEKSTTKELILKEDVMSDTALGGTSRIAKDGIATENAKTESVTIKTIDDSVPSDRAVAVIHLDIEGYEPQALRGAKNTIERCKPVIILETNDTAGAEVLKTMNYKEHKGLEMRRDKKVYRNTVFIPNEAP